MKKNLLKMKTMLEMKDTGTRQEPAEQEVQNTTTAGEQADQIGSIFTGKII
jgi:hypothetical protein